MPSIYELARQRIAASFEKQLEKCVVPKRRSPTEEGWRGKPASELTPEELAAKRDYQRRWYNDRGDLEKEEMKRKRREKWKAWYAAQPPEKKAELARKAAENYRRRHPNARRYKGKAAVTLDVQAFNCSVMYSLGDRVLYKGEILELTPDGFCRLTDNTVVNIPVNGKLSNEQGGQHAVRNEET